MKRELKENRTSLFLSGSLSYLRYFHNISSYDCVVYRESLYHLILCYQGSNLKLGSLSNRHYLHFLMQVQNQKVCFRAPVILVISLPVRELLKSQENAPNVSLVILREPFKGLKFLVTHTIKIDVYAWLYWNSTLQASAILPLLKICHTNTVSTAFFLYSVHK